MTVTIKEGFQYDETIFVEPGEYEAEPMIIDGYNVGTLIKVNDEWLECSDDLF